MRYGQLVMGPAGSGKSTYCTTMQRHAVDSKRVVHIVNLDPAAEHFDYQPIVDIRDLIQLDDAMEDDELHFGPNGGLVFCIEYLVKNADWLKEQLCGGSDDDMEGEPDDDYLLFDMPGQIELYTHLAAGKQLVNLLQSWNFQLCSVFLVDSQFMVDGSKFLGGTMAALSVMTNIELPHINILSKFDLLSKSKRKQLDQYLEPDPQALLNEVNNDTVWGKKYHKLSQAIGQLIDSFSLVRFTPLDIEDEESINDVLLIIDNVIQYGEDFDVRTKDYEEQDDEEGGAGDYLEDPNDYGGY